MRRWVYRARHDHECAVPIELADDGVPLSGFADRVALARAADREGPPLRLSVGSGP